MARILIAGHNATTADYLAEQMKKSGHMISRVDNALDAWRAIGRENFDVVVTDVAMPGIDGFVLAQKALQENPMTQVVFVTGFSASIMDVYATPSYAPAPVTSRPFHLRQTSSRLTQLMVHGLMQDAPRIIDGGAGATVIYPDFAARAAQQAQQA